MVAAIAILFSFVVCFLIALPLTQYRKLSIVEGDADTQDELYKRERLDVLLSDLELDFHTGKISEAEFQRMHSALLKQSAERHG